MKLGGCPERVPPRDWPTPKEGLERDPAQKEKEISVWGTQEDQVPRKLSATQKGSRKLWSGTRNGRRVFANFFKATQLSGQFLRRRAVLRLYSVCCTRMLRYIDIRSIKLPRPLLIIRDKFTESNRSFGCFSIEIFHITYYGVT